MKKYLALAAMAALVLVSCEKGFGTDGKGDEGDGAKVNGIVFNEIDANNKAIELYSEWKADKGANPRSDFNSMQWALREIEKPASITKSGRRLTAVQESGCDEVSEETLANLPF